MRKILKGIDKQLLFLSILLFAFGLIMVYSASNVTAFYVYGNSSGEYFLKQGLFLILGIFGFFFFLRFSSKKYYSLSKLGLVVFTTLIGFLVLYGTATNGSKNWIGIKGFGVQPSEFAKIAIIPFMAMFYEKYKEYTSSYKVYIPVAISVFIFILIILQNDYGTALIFIAISYFLFFFSNAKKKYKTWLALLGIVGVLFVTLLVSTGNIPKEKLIRLESNKDPCKTENYLNQGNQLCNSYIAINGGGILGKGLGNSTQKYLYLPEAYTDYIFAIIVEELGLVGGTALVVLYFLLIIKIVRIGKKSVKDSHAMICYGVAIYLFLHIIINLFGVLGIVPLTGIPLPFMSYGGSFAWSMILALTMVQRINYETNLKKD